MLIKGVFMHSGEPPPEREVSVWKVLNSKVAIHRGLYQVVLESFATYCQHCPNFSSYGSDASHHRGPCYPQLTRPAVFYYSVSVVFYDVSIRTINKYKAIRISSVKLK